jgi:hypothetical protein
MTEAKSLLLEVLATIPDGERSPNSSRKMASYNCPENAPRNEVTGERQYYLSAAGWGFGGVVIFSLLPRQAR